MENFNRTAGRLFEEVATPSAETCTLFSCIPFCEPFWRGATPDWLEACGAHIEGRVTATMESEIQGMRTLTFDRDVLRGTLGAERAFVEQVPKS